MRQNPLFMHVLLVSYKWSVMLDRRSFKRDYFYRSLSAKSIAVIAQILDAGTPTDLLPSSEQIKKTVIIHNDNTFDFATIVIRTNGKVAISYQLYNSASAIEPLEFDFHHA